MSVCAQSELLFAYAVHALPAGEIPAFEAHVASCAQCQTELAALRPVVQTVAGWPTDVLRPSGRLQLRLAERIAAETGGEPALPSLQTWAEPAWEEVAPGINCKLLANDTEKQVVSMLVRLAPGAAYPAHTHSGVEQLYLLEGELWIDERKLLPGDYNRGEPGASDKRVWSETGCTCVLVTSTKDLLA